MVILLIFSIVLSFFSTGIWVLLYELFGGEESEESNKKDAYKRANDKR